MLGNTVAAELLFRHLIVSRDLQPILYKQLIGDLEQRGPGYSLHSDDPLLTKTAP